MGLCSRPVPRCGLEKLLRPSGCGGDPCRDSRDIRKGKKLTAVTGTECLKFPAASPSRFVVCGPKSAMTLFNQNRAWSTRQDPEHPRNCRMGRNWMAQKPHWTLISTTLQKRKAAAPASSHGTSDIQLFDLRIPRPRIRDYILRRHIQRSAFC